MIRQQQVATLRQEQALGQRQILALELLAAPICDLRAMLTQEVVKNPLLDLVDDREDQSLPDEEPASDGDEEWVDALIRLGEEGPVTGVSAPRVSAEEEERRRHFLDSIAAGKTLQDDLNEQLQFLNPDPDLRECCEMIIAAVNENGYCTLQLADLAMIVGKPMETVERALELVQRLEPAGIAARDLRERLLIQMDRDGCEDELARRVVREHYDDLVHNRLPSLVRKLGVNFSDLEQVMLALRGLRPTLDLKPCHSAPNYVEEEVTVFECDGLLQVKVHAGTVPRLKINRRYREMLRDDSITDEAKVYLRQKLRDAALLMRSVDQRRHTLERVVQALVDIQHDYFVHGVEFLKPMTMAQVAEDAGVHETTVCRAVADKFVRCRYGLIPLRHYFSTGYEDRQGKLVSNQVVKNRIREIIGGEDEGRPIPDGRIAEMLKSEGLSVARRTVAKYRESMNIPACNQRRRYL